MDFITNPVTGLAYAPSEIWGSATMIVEFMDGATRTIPGVRFLAVVGFPNPVKVDGTTLTVESGDDILTMLGVRCFGWDFSC